jgi:hypothetical protein
MSCFGNFRGSDVKRTCIDQASVDYTIWEPRSSISMAAIMDV